MFEIMLAAELLSKAYRTELATPDGGELVSTTGMVFKAHHSYAAVKPHDYKCVLVPGGDPFEIMDNHDADNILRTAHATGTAIGAICAGPVVLAKAGILKERRFTHGYGDYHKDFLAPYWAGANFQDEAVVIDGNLVTAKPEAHIDFGIAIARIAGAIANDGTADYYRNYYKGNRLPQPSPA